MSEGRVWLVGAGPGDAGLLTLKGCRLLEQADTVVYDHLISAEILAMIPRGTERIDVGKEAGHHKIQQEKINRLLVQEAQKGKQVVRLKGGDPFLFGRGGEEAALLHACGVPFEIVPGVTSAIAVPAYAGIPVTHRGCASALYIVTAHRRGEIPCGDIDFSALAALKDTTLVFLMGVAMLRHICDGLTAAGMPGDTPAAVIEQGTTAAQRTVRAPLERLADEASAAGIGTPGVIIVGDVCGYADTLSWRDMRSLDGARLLLTRPRNRMSRIAGMLRDLGAEVIELPAVHTEILPADSARGLGSFMPGTYDFLIFTSVSGVEAFFDQLQQLNSDVRAIGHARIAAIGAATARALQERGLHVDCMPTEYSGAALGTALCSQLKKGDRALLCTPEQCDTDCMERLESQGIVCDRAVLYRTVEEPIFAELLPDSAIAVFASASAVHSFARSTPPEYRDGLCAVCIGKKTAAAAEACGMHAAVAETATAEGLVYKTLEVYHNRKCN